MSVPRSHYKCRYDDEDPHAKVQAYTRTTDVMVTVGHCSCWSVIDSCAHVHLVSHFKRGAVPRDMIKWTVDFEDYSPIEFTSAKILTKDGLAYKDPHMLVSSFLHPSDDQYNFKISFLTIVVQNGPRVS